MCSDKMCILQYTDKEWIGVYLKWRLDLFTQGVWYKIENTKTTACRFCATPWQPIQEAAFSRYCWGGGGGGGGRAGRRVRARGVEEI